MNVKKELIQIPGIVNVVCRDSGILEIYYIDPLKKERIQKDVLSFLNQRCLNDCFVSSDFIQVKERVILK
jgi:hypothetical protein